jgi:hypothetical protein
MVLDGMASPSTTMPTKGLVGGIVPDGVPVHGHAKGDPKGHVGQG